MMNTTTHPHVDKLSTYIGNLLRIGVYLSVTIVIIGILLALVRQDLFVDGELFHITKENENYFMVFYNDLKQGKSVSVIILGIMIMLFTPVLRLLFALVGFLLEKDYLYVVITAAVLGVMALSIILGASH
ncbi:MAG: DUF1634 domain-containing protein [Capnocytophaga sp.]|nr:DUF1634 domain-containing protein [Capnocytophaga sp.]